MTENPYQSPAYISYPHRTDVAFGNPVTARGQLTPRDMGQLARLVTAPSWRQVVFCLLFAGAMFSVSLCLLYWTPARSVPEEFSPQIETARMPYIELATIAILVLLVIVFLYANQRYNRQASDAKQGVFAEQTVRVSAEGLEFAFGGIRSVIPWTAVLWSRHNKTMLAFQTNGPVVWWALPRRWFDKDEHWDQVVEFFEYRLVASRDSDRITQIACQG